MDKLAEIMQAKRSQVAAVARPVRDEELEAFARHRPEGPSFREALAAPGHLSVIAEIKRKSPSAGAIAEDMEAEEQARCYLNAGVDAMSILTDEIYFGGSLRDLWEVTDFIAEHQRTVPCLRKDFMIHPVQVVEAAEAGARCILIIARALSYEEMAGLFRSATLAGLDAIFEIHSLPELETILPLKPKIIGVNNRDLSRFVTDLSISETIIPRIPDGIVTISESGIFGPEDARRAREAGADAILVGEALMRIQNEEELEATVAALRKPA